MALDKFPSLIGQGFIAEKTPVWKTRIAEAQTGRERRNRLWSYPRWRFRISYDVLRLTTTSPDLSTLWAFFNRMAGRAAEWAYLDPTDNAVTNQAFGVGDGTTRAFQLLRTVNAGGFLFTEPVRAVDGSPTCFAGGSPASASADDNGVVTFATAPASGAVLSWTGTFLYHVRFDQDELSATQMMQQLWSQSGLSFVTVKT